ncbi:uncharacterized protein MICPUCDRAFT_53742 [Micromonas pusilla CCMP1545]|uniref:Predicted protein n=1 Tax=Micromonas pusilla (strain CCMP1545) TaxID=564608 RepID=C1N7L4_MICPC|nr:uncharacterized protein MICPUCDRAFT_53742 [Micromonas pusilla CCMP1545]EEH51546.1 predicted protein [Micromonas pusilla CCMP1545]|eukprot:XP_003063924.1 predicted protein [Micromonas pusilla CCMP1545]
MKRHFLAAPTRALPTPPRMKPPDPASVGAYPGANDASSRDYSKWDDAISVERVRQLRDEGWCVVDDFLGGGGASSSSSDATSRGADGADVASGERWATAIRDEIKWLSGTGLMRPNRTHFANPKGERHLFAKPNVYETDLHEEEIRVLCPELDALFRESATRLANAFTARIDELSAMEYREANEQQEAMDKHKAELFSPSRARILDCHEHHPDHPDHPVRRHSELTREVGDYEHISEPRAPSEANSEDEDESPSPPGGASVKAPGAFCYHTGPHTTAFAW